MNWRHTQEKRGKHNDRCHQVIPTPPPWLTRVRLLLESKASHPAGWSPRESRLHATPPSRRNPNSISYCTFKQFFKSSMQLVPGGGLGLGTNGMTNFSAVCPMLQFRVESIKVTAHHEGNTVPTWKVTSAGIKACSTVSESKTVFFSRSSYLWMVWEALEVGEIITASIRLDSEYASVYWCPFFFFSLSFFVVFFSWRKGRDIGTAGSDVSMVVILHTGDLVTAAHLWFGETYYFLSFDLSRSQNSSIIGA